MRAQNRNEAADVPRRPSVGEPAEGFSGAFGQRRGISSRAQQLREIELLPISELVGRLPRADIEVKRRLAERLHEHLLQGGEIAPGSLARQRLWSALTAEHDSTVAAPLLAGLTAQLQRDATSDDVRDAVSYLAFTADDHDRREPLMALAQTAAEKIAAKRDIYDPDQETYEELLALYHASGSEPLAWITVAAGIRKYPRPDQLSEVLRADPTLAEHGELARAWAQLMPPTEVSVALLAELAPANLAPAPGSPMADLAAYWTREFATVRMRNAAWTLMADHWDQAGPAYDPLKERMLAELVDAEYFPEGARDSLRDGRSLQMARRVLRAAGASDGYGTIPRLFGADNGSAQRQLPEYRQAAHALAQRAADQARRTVADGVMSLTGMPEKGEDRRTLTAAYGQQFADFAQACNQTGDWASAQFEARAITGEFDDGDLYEEVTERLAAAFADLLSTDGLAGALLASDSGTGLLITHRANRRKLRKAVQNRGLLLAGCDTALGQERLAASGLFPAELGERVARSCLAELLIASQ